MGLDDRILYLLVGASLGFVLGYVTRAIRDIKEELDEVDEKISRDRDERGFMRFPIVANFSLILVLGIAVYASFATQQNNNEIKATQVEVVRTQDLLEQVTLCNQMYLERTVMALNERTTYSSDQASANVNLIRAQARFLRVLLTEPAPDEKVSRDALREYFDPAVVEFIEFNEKALNKYETNAYPTVEEVNDCLDDVRE